LSVQDFYVWLIHAKQHFEHLKGAVMRFGCRNCTNKEPPINNYMPFSAAFHEGRGAMLYLRWSQPFR